MEKLEFFLIKGQTCIRREDGSSKPLTQADREAISFMIENLKLYFPKTFDRLCEWAAESAMNRPFFEYRIVDRFIRCNFGEADFMYFDIDDNFFHFEEVKCPLRGICKDEGVICKPKAILGLTVEEEKVVKLYSKGYLPGEISEQLGKAEKTCKEYIRRACKRLKVPHARWLIRLFNAYTF